MRHGGSFARVMLRWLRRFSGSSDRPGRSEIGLIHTANPGIDDRRREK